MGNQASSHVMQSVQHNRNNNIPPPQNHFYRNNQTAPYPNQNGNINIQPRQMQPQQQPRIQQRPVQQQRRPQQQINRGMQQQTGNLQYNTRPQNQGEVFTERENVLPPQRQMGGFMPYPVSSVTQDVPNRKSAMSNKIVPTNSYDMSNVNYNNVNETIQNFNSQQEIDEQNFLKKQEEEKQKFYKSQNAKFDKFKSELDNFEKIYNPFKILKLDYDADQDQIKKSYRKLSLKYHPDRPEGNEKKFQLITKAYIYLLNKIKETRGIKSHTDLRKEAQNYFENEQPEVIKQTKTKENTSQEKLYVDDKNFDVNKFNKIFDENRMGSVYDKGYGDGWGEEDEEENVVFDKKFSLDVFNSVFNQQKEKKISKKKSNQVMIVDQPEPMLSTGLNFEELGLDNVNDFSSKTHENMGFTDYKSAYHTNNMLDYDESYKRKDYRNLNDLENERSKISYKLSDTDQRKMEELEAYEKEKEEKRIQNLMAYDQMIERHHENVNSRFIKNR